MSARNDRAIAKLARQLHRRREIQGMVDLLERAASQPRIDAARKRRVETIIDLCRKAMPDPSTDLSGIRGRFGRLCGNARLGAFSATETIGR